MRYQRQLIGGFVGEYVLRELRLQVGEPRSDGRETLTRGPLQRGARTHEIGMQALQQTLLLFAELQRGR